MDLEEIGSGYEGQRRRYQHQEFIAGCGLCGISLKTIALVVGEVTSSKILGKILVVGGVVSLGGEFWSNVWC